MAPIWSAVMLRIQRRVIYRRHCKHAYVGERLGVADRSENDDMLAISC